MATSAHITNACPRLSTASRFTTDEVLAILGERPERKRNGTLRAIVVRAIPRFDKVSASADGLNFAIV